MKKSIDINIILIYLLFLFLLIGALNFFEPLRFSIYGPITLGHILEPLLYWFGIFAAYILFFQNIDSRGYKSFINDKKFILIALFMTAIFFFGGSSHWVANIINEYKSIFLTTDLKNIVHFFDEVYGHLVPFTMMTIANCYAVFLEAKRPLEIKYTNFQMWINLIISIILGIGWALVLIEGSSGLVATIILIPASFICCIIALKLSKWNFWGMQYLPFLHYVLISSMAAFGILILWFMYYGSFKQISEII